MLKMFKNSLLPISLIFLLVMSVNLFAVTKEVIGKGKKDEIQRTPTELFDLQRNTVSNISFYTSNYGIFGLDTKRGEGGGYWPRGSQNQYIFGGGIWFAAIKNRPDTNIQKKYVEVTYNPNSGKSWMVPGRIDDGDAVDDKDIYKYRTYFSTDMLPNSGEPRVAADGPSWPIWDASSNPKDTLKKNRYFGYYIPNVNERNRDKYSKGPAFISGEDIFCTYKDTDLKYFEGGFNKRKNEGYPLRLQFEQMIYSWGFGDYRDFIFIKFEITNRSNDTLKSCWMAPVMDVDIARAPNTRSGAANDRVRFYESDPTKNLAFQWTNNNLGEAGRGFGYLGFDFLESPAVIHSYDTVVVRDNNGNPIDTILREKITPETGFVRKDSTFYSNSSQLGLVTFRNWPIEIDPQGDEERYDFMALGQREGDTGPGDKRFMMATGPFNMRPNDTVRVVVGIILANTASGTDADGSDKDAALLIAKDEFAQKVYDNNFQAPKPPDRASFQNPVNLSTDTKTQRFKPLNNGIMLTWDSTSEMSEDANEKGLDFMGYKLYRARRTNLDTFNVDQITANEKFTNGQGPFGWRQVGQWQIQTPFIKSSHTAGYADNENPDIMIDSVKIVGLVNDPNDWIDGLDEFAVKALVVGRGMILLPDSLARFVNAGNKPNPTQLDLSMAPVIVKFDTALFSQPWGKWYNEQISQQSYPMFTYNYGGGNYLLDSIFMGKIYLNRANLDYNPLFWRQLTVRVPKDIVSKLPAKGIYNSWKFRTNPNDPNLKDSVLTIDSVYKASSFRFETVAGTSTYYMDVLYPRRKDSIMFDEAHIKACLDSIYTYIKKGYVAKWDFPDFASSLRAKNEVIVPWMNRVTQNRTFVDLGDLNRDGVIDYNADPARTEKLLNNVDYYYKLLAFDEGDFLQPTSSKANDAPSEELPNMVKAYALAATAGKQSEFEITHIDSNLIGGLYNFKFFGLNQDRIQQLYAGHEFEMEFNPHWTISQVPINFGTPDQVNKNIGLYHTQVIIRDLTTKEDLFNAYTYYEVQPCQILYRGAWTENAASWVLSDKVIVDTIGGGSISFGTRFDHGTEQRSGTVFSGDFTTPGYCYTFGFYPKAYGTLGFSFDYAMKQFGGEYRADSSSAIIKGNAVTPISFYAAGSGDTLTTRVVTIASQGEPGYGTYFPDEVYGSFNNGPVNLQVDFEEGGYETLELKWGKDNEFSNTFNVHYLIPKVKNTISYKRPKESNPLDSVEVSYPDPIQHMNLASDDQTTTRYPSPLTLLDKSNDFINKFNLSAYGFINGRGNNRSNVIDKQNAKGKNDPDSIKWTNIGQQGRYYTSALSTDGKDTLDFVHVLCGSSAQFVFDYANKGRRVKSTSEWGAKPTTDYIYSEDFKPGDQAMLKTTGGALGLPLPGAKVRFRVTASVPEMKDYTDDQLDQINVVPNPYYITHQGQKSPYDGKVYFTKLPKQCTINIYTVTGDLIKTIEHNEDLSPAPDRIGVNIWDLMSDNRQRVESQTLIAYITTPNGAQTIKKFSVVVGSARLIQD